MNESIPLLIDVVKEDAGRRNKMAAVLEQMGFEVRKHADATAFYRATLLRRADVALLDVDLPGEGGVSIAAHMRAVGELGLILLSTRDGVADRLEALRVADAYLIKPIDLRELAATIRAVARRVKNVSIELTQAWQLIDNGWMLCSPDRQHLALTSAERGFLQRLFEQPGEPVPRDRLALALGEDPTNFDSHRLDSLANRLRRKAQEAGMALPLRTVRNSGYLFRVSTEPGA